MLRPQGHPRGNLDAPFVKPQSVFAVQCCAHSFVTQSIRKCKAFSVEVHITPNRQTGSRIPRYPTVRTGAHRPTYPSPCVIGWLSQDTHPAATDTYLTRPQSSQVIRRLIGVKNRVISAATLYFVRTALSAIGT